MHHFTQQKYCPFFMLCIFELLIVKEDDERFPFASILCVTFSFLALLASYYKFLGGYPIVAVAALLLYVGCYQISFGPISWLMVSEIFPIRTRGRGISLAVLTNFGSNAIELLGAGNLFLLFGSIALLSLLFVALIVPDKRLELGGN
ncbi:hypothetical protein HHK36_019097 [Tetracentron sinense]|uniref:Major facilitator superfamily (MFS) profile domain-containing protein n=1 Tax=Tetracentron sinense TaxID=13715 RepID=A0A834YYP0_TETSI|nr:hypothetical protein HHK36_019097 [Tetracentron sinense]